MKLGLFLIALSLSYSLNSIDAMFLQKPRFQDDQPEDSDGSSRSYLDQDELESDSDEYTCADGCVYYLIGDGQCDESCYNDECYWDGGDCFGEPTSDNDTCSDGCYSAWVGDGVCDYACYNEDCYYDGGDCNDEQDEQEESDEIEYAEEESDEYTCNDGCTYDMIGDGYCDTNCLVLDCYYDKGDCNEQDGVDVTYYYCNQDCPYDHIGDDICDDACNSEECFYDGGDCNIEEEADEEKEDV